PARFPTWCAWRCWVPARLERSQHATARVLALSGVMAGAIPSRNCLVLIDDDPHVLSALRFAFEADGYEVSAFASGEALLASPPMAANVCIVIDHRLSGLSGLETLARLRRRGVTAPAVLITSNPSSELCRRAREVGVDIVEKPLITSALPRKVAAAL